MSLWEVWSSILFRKAFFVQGFGLFPLLQVSKQNCCLPVLPLQNRSCGLCMGVQVTVGRRQGLPSLGIDGCRIIPSGMLCIWCRRKTQTHFTLKWLTQTALPAGFG